MRIPGMMGEEDLVPMAHHYHERVPISTATMKGSRNGGIKYGVPKIIPQNSDHEGVQKWGN